MTKTSLNREIAEIKRQLVTKYHPDKIILIGSAAWGKFTKDSDLDFVIIKKRVPHYGRDRMKQVNRLIDSSLPVDLLVYKPEEFEERSRMGDPFIKLVISKGRIIYG